MIGLVSLVFMFLVGCATAPVKLNPVAGAPKVELNKYDTLVVEISKAETVEMSKKDLEEMGTLITQAIQKHCRFKQVLNGSSTNKSSLSPPLVLEVRFTEFVPTNIINELFLPIRLRRPKISSEIVLRDSGGKSIMSGPLSKHLGSTLAGGEQAGLKDGLGGMLRTFGWLKERFAEGIAKGIATALPSS